MLATLTKAVKKYIWKSKKTGQKLHCKKQVERTSNYSVVATDGSGWNLIEMFAYPKFTLFDGSTGQIVSYSKSSMRFFSKSLRQSSWKKHEVRPNGGKSKQPKMENVV